jgi:hypothetical protein
MQTFVKWISRAAVEAGTNKLRASLVFDQEFHMRMSGYADPMEVRVEVLEEPEPGCYYGFLRANGTLSWVYPTELQVKMCSPDFLQRAISEGEGRIVPARVRLKDNATS